MCGIVGYVGDRDCADVLVDALSKLEYRGYDSAGIAVVEKGVIKVEKCKGRLANLVDKMAVDGKPQGHCGIGHIRWATHGEPSDIIPIRTAISVFQLYITVLLKITSRLRTS